MNATARATVFAFALAYSTLGITQPTVELIWSSTSGSGTPGSSEITAATGDYLELEIYVTGDSDGMWSAFIPLSWDAADLTAYNAENVCASGCSGGNGSGISTLFVAAPGGVTVNPGSAVSFNATGVDVSVGFPSPGYFNDTLLLGRIDYYVESGGSIEVVSADYSASGGVTSADQARTTYYPAASATINPPPGCG